MKHGEQNRLLALLMAVAMIVAMLPVGMVIPAAAADAVYAVDFNEAEDLNDFQAYYADNAKNGLNAAAMAENWTINNGMVERVQPAGKQYWMSNNDSYEKNGVGQTDYGLVAELVYTARKYTNFELTVDARQVSGISRQFGVGFGKTELGAFFVNTEGVANAAGGAYACVERGGATNLFGYAINTVNGSTGALVGGRVQGTTVASGNSVEHSVKVRVEDSKMSMWVKAKGADDSSYVKVLTDVALKNYQGGYISLMTSANAAFDNLSITDLDPQIVSVESGMEINVAKGTALDKISFPQQVTVADGNGNTYQVPVAFACDSYDANTLGAYTFAGILDMSSVAAQNGSGLTASLTVNVMNAADIAAKVSVDFNESADLIDFTSYYAQNARDGLIATAFAEDWTNDGNVARLAKPHGIGGFWQSNNDGNGIYGYLAELVYTKRQYTNFELTVDAMQVAESIGRQFGIGFGKTELGAFFVDNNNQMNAAGGAYVGVERNGATNLWGYSVNTVNGSTGALANNARVQGTTVTSPVKKWHTVKVRVENSAVSMWVKDLGAEDSAYVQVLTDVALKNYQGGYISLMTNANAAFDNLTIINLDPQIVAVGAVNEIVVAQGTAAEDIDFPAQVTVTDENGGTYKASVSFSCASYDADTLGQYTFVGELNVDGMAVQNGSSLTASVVVNVLSVADFAARVSFNFNEAADLNDFASYYAKDAREGLTATAFAEDWTNNGNVARLAKPHGIGGYWQSNVDGSGVYGYMAELVYTKRQYTNFELTVDAMQVAESIGRQFGIGFGKTELGAFFVDSSNQANAAGGAYVGVERNGATNLWGYAVNTVNGSTGALVGGRVQGTAVTSPVGKWHTVKVRVENSAVSMWVKDLGAEDSAYVQVLTNVALKNYQGGYISLMTNANAAFDNLTIINLDPQITSTESIRNIAVVKGTENVIFPATVSVTDVNGAVHQVPVSFSCDSFDGNTVGDYTFAGTLNISGMALQNGNNVKATVVVSVLSTADMALRTEIDFNEAADLNDFASYYAQNARDGLTATAFAEDWTNDDNVTRLAKPHGIGGFWQSNVDSNGAYGYVAELVYTKQQYVNFELTVDAMQVAESIGRQFGIGFGKTELGAFFVDNDNQMNAAGGAYVGVERNGATSLWGYAVNTVNGSTNAIASNGRVGGTSVTSPCSKWHTVKVRVEDGKVSMWVKDLGAADSTYAKVLSEVALKDYTGGYISLMTNANAAFDNLLIVNLDKVETAEIEKWNLTLGEDIGANFYANVPEEHLADTTVAVTVAGQAAAAQTSTEDGYLKISVNVAAAQMTDDIVVSIVCNGITVEETYSVYQYALYVLADEKDEFDEKTEKLVKEMLNYGAAAQTYFGYNGENIIDADLIAGAGAAEIDSSNVTDMSVSGTVEGVSFYGASLLFKSKTAVRFYFTGDISECTVSAGTVKQAADGKYYVEIEGIVPQDLSQSITLTVQSGEQSIVVVYGPMNYIERMSEKGSAGLQQLLKAMYNYHLAAVEYAA